MSYSSSFPGLALGFSPAALPIPFVDASYHNDACARFEPRGTNPDRPAIGLWVDYADERSEYFGTDLHFRYTVDFGTYGDGNAQPLLQTNDLPDLVRFLLALATDHAGPARAALAVAIGRTFRDLLETELTTPVLHEVIDRNRAEADASTCHSHDFCDANMVMNAAMEQVLDREAVMTWDVDSGECTAAQHEADMWLFNNSWKYANLR